MGQVEVALELPASLGDGGVDVGGGVRPREALVPLPLLRHARALLEDEPLAVID